MRILRHSTRNVQTYYSRISKDEKNETAKPKFQLDDKKYVQGNQTFVRFRWFFELCEFELKEFSVRFY